MRAFMCALCLASGVLAATAYAGSGISPVSSTGSAEQILQAQVGEAAQKAIEKAKARISKKIKGFEKIAAGKDVILNGMGTVAANTCKVETMPAEMQRQYKEFNEMFEKLRLEIEGTPEKLAEAGGNSANKDMESRAEEENPTNKDLETIAEDEKNAAEEEQKAAEDEKDKGGSGVDEPLSEAAQKAVDEERARRKKEAEDFAGAEEDGKEI